MVIGNVYRLTLHKEELCGKMLIQITACAIFSQLQRKVFIFGLFFQFCINTIFYEPHTLFTLYPFLTFGVHRARKKIRADAVR